MPAAEHFLTPRIGILSGRILGLIEIICIYVLVSYSGVFPAEIFVPPEKVIQELFAWARSGRLFDDAFASVVRVTTGWIGGSFVGIIIGILAGSYSRLRKILTPFVDFTRVISPLAWIPFFIVLFGIGNMPAIMLVALASFFPCFTAAADGVLSLPRGQIEVAKNLGCSDIEMLFKVLLPLVMPSLLAGMRISLGIGWYVVIAAEMIGAQSGLGYVVNASRLTLSFEAVVAAILVIGMIGMALSTIVEALISRLCPWGSKQ